MIDISKIGHNISSTNSVIIRLIQLGNYLIPLEPFSYVLFLYSLYICIKFKKRIIFNFFPLILIYKIRLDIVYNLFIYSSNLILFLFQF